MDSRGQREDGSYWRRALFSDGDAASYWLQQGEKPYTSDKIIDSACFAKGPHIKSWFVPLPEM
jgi:hypothetical protein